MMNRIGKVVLAVVIGIGAWDFLRGPSILRSAAGCGLVLLLAVVLSPEGAMKRSWALQGIALLGLLLIGLYVFGSPFV